MTFSTWLSSNLTLAHIVPLPMCLHGTFILVNYSCQIIRLWRELHSVANLNPSLHPSKLRLCAHYRLPLRWHILTLTCNGDALALTLVLRWRSTGALQGNGSLLIELAFSCLNLNWAMWLLSKQATKVAHKLS